MNGFTPETLPGMVSRDFHSKTLKKKVLQEDSLQDIDTVHFANKVSSQELRFLQFNSKKVLAFAI